MMTKNLMITGIAIAGLSFGSMLFAEEHKHGEGCDHDGAHATEHQEEGQDGKEGHEHHAGCSHSPAKTHNVKVADVAVVAFSHIKDRGAVVLAVFGKDGKTALKPAAAPRLNLTVNGKRKQLKTTAMETVKDGNVFAVASELLSGEITGQIIIKIGDKSYRADIYPHAHGAGCDHGHAPVKKKEHAHGPGCDH